MINHGGHGENKSKDKNKSGGPFNLLMKMTLSILALSMPFATLHAEPRDGEVPFIR